MNKQHQKEMLTARLQMLLDKQHDLEVQTTMTDEEEAERSRAFATTRTQIKETNASLKEVMKDLQS